MTVISKIGRLFTLTLSFDRVAIQKEILEENDEQSVRSPYISAFIDV